jgi:hypothetical protein
MQHIFVTLIGAIVRQNNVNVFLGVELVDLWSEVERGLGSLIRCIY